MARLNFDGFKGTAYEACDVVGQLKHYINYWEGQLEEAMEGDLVSLIANAMEHIDEGKKALKALKEELSKINLDIKF